MNGSSRSSSSSSNTSRAGMEGIKWALLRQSRRVSDTQVLGCIIGRKSGGNAVNTGRRTTCVYTRRSYRGGVCLAITVPTFRSADTRYLARVLGTAELPSSSSHLSAHAATSPRRAAPTRGTGGFREVGNFSSVCGGERELHSRGSPDRTNRVAIGSRASGGTFRCSCDFFSLSLSFSSSR